MDRKVGERLAKHREKTGKSIREVAADLNISYSSLSYYESGKRIPRDDVKALIAKYYGTTVGSLFFAEGVHDS